MTFDEGRNVEQVVNLELCLFTTASLQTLNRCVHLNFLCNRQVVCKARSIVDMFEHIFWVALFGPC